MKIIVSELSVIMGSYKQIISDTAIKISEDISVLEYSDMKSILPNKK